jgi:hypothetical protein
MNVKAALVEVTKISPLVAVVRKLLHEKQVLFAGKFGLKKGVKQGNARVREKFPGCFNPRLSS